MKMQCIIINILKSVQQPLTPLPAYSVYILLKMMTILDDPQGKQEEDEDGKKAAMIPPPGEADIVDGSCH